MTYYAINIIVIYYIVIMPLLKQQKTMYQMFQIKYQQKGISLIIRMIFLLVTLTQRQFKSMFLIFIIKIKSILKELRNNLKMKFSLMIILVYLLQMPRHSIMIKEMELLFYLIIFLLIKVTVIPLKMEIMI